MQMLRTVSGNTAAPVGATANIPVGTGLFSGANAARNKAILAGSLSGISALSSIARGNAQADALNAQSQQTSLLAQRQALVGKEQELRLREQLGVAKGNAVAALGASGISGGSTVAATLNQIESSAASELAGVRAGTQSQVLSSRITALSQRGQALAARKEGKFGAFGAAASFGTNVLLRGRV